MKEKTKILILALLGMNLSLFLLYHLLAQNASPRQTLPKPQEKTEVKLNLAPSEAKVSPGETLEIRVLAETQEKLIATDLELAFDPQFLVLEEVKPGDFWSNPQELTKVIDNQKGKVFYGIASFEPKKGSGVIASFRFAVEKISSPSISTQIAFREETQVSLFGKETKLILSPPGKYVILKINE